jgi:hypothetical protein
MSEQIQLLSIMARSDARSNKHYLERVHNKEITAEEYQEMYDQKFAELIISKCVEICNQSILHNEDMLPKFNKPSELYEKLVTHGAIFQAEKLIDGITQYFGVE